MQFYAELHKHSMLENRKPFNAKISDPKPNLAIGCNNRYNFPQ